MRLKNRLRRLERSLPEPGCLACRDRRGRIVLVDCQEQQDGTVVRLQPLPAPCGACGKLPEFIIEAIMPFTAGDAQGPPAHQGGE